MSTARSLMISLAVSAAVTLALSVVFGIRTFALFLALPIAIFAGTRRGRKPPPGHDNRPIEPR